MQKQEDLKNAITQIFYLKTTIKQFLPKGFLYRMYKNPS
jgi:hypothetical protein